MFQSVTKMYKNIENLGKYSSFYNESFLKNVIIQFSIKSIQFFLLKASWNITQKNFQLFF